MLGGLELHGHAQHLGLVFEEPERQAFATLGLEGARGKAELGLATGARYVQLYGVGQPAARVLLQGQQLGAVGDRPGQEFLGGQPQDGLAAWQAQQRQERRVMPYDRARGIEQYSAVGGLLVQGLDDREHTALCIGAGLAQLDMDFGLERPFVVVHQVGH